MRSRPMSTKLRNALPALKESESEKSEWEVACQC